MEINQDWIEIIKNIILGSQQSNIIKGSLILLLGISAIFIKRWIKKMKIRAAREITERQRQEHQNQIDRESREISQDNQNSEDRVEDIINGE